MPARGAYASHLPAPRGVGERFVGIVRGPIASAEQAIEIFRGVDAGAIADARRRGLLSHELFIKLGPPGAPLELLGLDMWADDAGMNAHYDDATHMRGARRRLHRPGRRRARGAPAAGSWSEW